MVAMVGGRRLSGCSSGGHGRARQRRCGHGGDGGEVGHGGAGGHVGMEIAAALRLLLAVP